MQNLASLQKVRGSFDLCRYVLNILSSLDLTPTAKLVLIELCDHYNPGKEDVFPSQEYISKRLGVSLRQVKDSITQLRKQNIILITKKANLNHYYFSNTFFALIGCENRTLKSAESAPACIEQIREQKNNRISFFQKKSAGQIEATTKLINESFNIEHKSPMDDFETAKNWLAGLTENELKHQFIKLRADEVKKNWGL